MASKEEFLALARKRFETAAEEEKQLRANFISDLKFASPDGEDQWDAQMRLQRQAAGRPAMAFPRCHTFVQQVSNEARQNKPQIKFAPRLESDKDTAEVYEGLARYIQYASEAQIAYETAIEYSAGASFGFYRFTTEYCDDDSDDLELKILPVLDPLTVYGILVPACFGQKPRFGFVIEEISREEYKVRYPGTDIASMSWSDAEQRNSGWVSAATVRIAEYWWVEEKKVEGKRRLQRIVNTCKINGFEILPDTETVWAGSTIPIIPVLGKQMIMEGKPKLFSVVRPQKDAQKLINYSKTRIAETLSTAPITPWMVAEGQISGYEQQWASANVAPPPYLTYKSTDTAGRPVPTPVRQTFEPPIQSLSSFVLQEVDDMKATSGIFDASLGNSANETTGKAILARQQQSSLSTMHYLDNLERSFRQAGDIIAELIPKIYDTAREITILGEDEKQKVIQINEAFEDEDGKEKHYKIPEAKFRYVVTMGRAYSTKRMESFDMMQQLVQSAPNLLPMFGDVLFKNSDMAGADVVAERFEKMLPPQLQNQHDEIPPQAQAVVAQAQQQVQMMQGEIAKLTQERDAKVLDHQAKMQQIQLQHQSDMDLEDKKLEVEIAKAEISTKAQNEQERQIFLQDIEKMLLKHRSDMQAQHVDHAHDVAKTAMVHEHAKETSAIAAAQQEDTPEPAEE